MPSRALKSPFASIRARRALEQDLAPDRGLPAGGGGGGVDLAPNGAFGDLTQEPCFMGYFADVNDIYYLNGGDTSIFMDGCWALADTGVGEPHIYVVNNAVA